MNTLKEYKSTPTTHTHNKRIISNEIRNEGEKRWKRLRLRESLPMPRASGIAISRISHTHMECICENENYRKDRQAPEQLVEFLNSGT